MVDSTPRFGLDIFEAGENNWSHTDTVETVDELAIKRGPISERPSTGEYDDEFYYAIDQLVLWRWDATAGDWKIAGGAGTEGTPLPASYIETLHITDSEQTPSQAGEFTRDGDSIFAHSGGASRPLGGKIGNIEQAVETAPYYETVSSNSESSDLMTLEFTPSTSDSNVLITVSTSATVESGYTLYLTLFRDGDRIYVGDQAGSRRRASAGSRSDHEFNMNSFSFMYLDSPNTTSTVTYSIRGSHNSTSASPTIYLNRRPTDPDSEAVGRFASSITAMEILNH